MTNNDLRDKTVDDDCDIDSLMKSLADRAGVSLDDFKDALVDQFLDTETDHEKLRIYAKLNIKRARELSSRLAEAEQRNAEKDKVILAQQARIEWLRQFYIEHRQPWDRDAACSCCAPESEMIIDGFRCEYHTDNDSQSLAAHDQQIIDATLEKAKRACLYEAVDAFATGSKGDEAYNTALRHAADAIHKLKGKPL